MAVQCMTDEQKLALYEDVVDNNMSKSKAAIKYSISTRTVGRVIDEIAERTQIPVSSEEVNKSITYDQYGLPEISIVEDDDEDDELDLYEDGEEGEDDVSQEEFGEVIDDEDITHTFIMTPDSISITRVCGDDVDTINLEETHEKFEEVYELIMSNPRDEETIAEAYRLVSIKLRYEEASNGTVTVIPEEGKVVCNLEGYDIKVGGQLADRLIDASIHADDEKLEGLMAFTERLMNNPSPRAVKELYEFLEAADIEIKRDGMIECFKKVTADFKDCRTGRFDNSVGKTVFEPRFMVDDNSNRTCSNGLHVCSFAYLGSYPGSKIIKVHVDPADVVSIPDDYYSLDGSGNVKAKARVCRYKVVEDVTDKYHQYAYGN